MLINELQIEIRRSPSPPPVTASTNDSASHDGPSSERSAAAAPETQPCLVKRFVAAIRQEHLASFFDGIGIITDSDFREVQSWDFVDRSSFFRRFVGSSERQLSDVQCLLIEQGFVKHTFPETVIKKSAPRVACDTSAPTLKNFIDSLELHDIIPFLKRIGLSKDRDFVGLLTVDKYRRAEFFWGLIRRPISAHRFTAFQCEILLRGFDHYMA